LTDAEWALVEPLMPAVRRVGRPRRTDLCDRFDAILSIAATGCQWRMLPDDFPPVSTLRGCFCAWRNDGLLEEINGKPVEVARLAGGRKAAPTAGISDSQSVNATESGGVRGYDAGKRIKGRKRHIVTDTTGLPVALRVHSAGIQDRDGAPEVLKSVAARYPSLHHIFADGGHAGPRLRDALKAAGCRTVQIVKRSDIANGFEVLPRRWVVERTLAWPGRCRRLSKDREKLIASAGAWVLIAHIRRVTRYLARI
jgi:transposase